MWKLVSAIGRNYEKHWDVWWLFAILAALVLLKLYG
jgi:hypothetical protein